MALYTKTRTDGATPTEYADEVVRTCFIYNRRTGATEVWSEWDIDLGNGRRVTRSARCDPAVEAEILALPNVGSGLQMASENTHPKVLAA
jgi:hypothetical protein